MTEMCAALWLGLLAASLSPCAAFTFAGAYGGCVVGVRGPAVTADGGRTWSYPCDGRATERSFSYAFETDGEVRFCSTWQEAAR